MRDRVPNPSTTDLEITLRVGVLTRMVAVVL